MTPYTHLTDHELVNMVEFWPATMPALTSLERELGARLANAVDTLEDNEANLAALQAKADNTTGFKGVTWDKARGKFKAHIKIHGAITNLGRFSTAEAAAEAYNRAATATHGPFANLGTAA